MKIIFRILVILLIVVTVSGGVYALVENTNLISSNEARREARPQTTRGDGASSQPIGRSEGGDEHAASLSRGLGEASVLVSKIAVITAVILLVQKGMRSLQNKRSMAA